MMMLFILLSAVDRRMKQFSLPSKAQNTDASPHAV